MSLYSRIDGISADVRELQKELRSLANHPQSQRTSIEGGVLEFNDSDGNLKSVLGEREDGSNTLEVVNGPTPATPINFIVSVDFGQLIVHWDGEFEGALVANADWARTEIYAQPGAFVTPSREFARGSIVAASGGEVSIGVLKGQWTVCLVSWSQAGKMSLMSIPITVDVPGFGEIVLEEIDAAETNIKNGADIIVEAGDTLGGKLTSAFGRLDDVDGVLVDVNGNLTDINGNLVDINGNLIDLNGNIVDINGEIVGIGGSISRIDAALAALDGEVEGAIASANGKNTVHYEDHAPSAADPGIYDDTWFVGRVGRPGDMTDYIEGTNLLRNPSFEVGNNDEFLTHLSPTTQPHSGILDALNPSGSLELLLSVIGDGGTTAFKQSEPIPVTAGQWVGTSALAGSEYGQAGIGLFFYSDVDGTWYAGEDWSAPTGTAKRHTLTMQVPAGAVSVTSGLRLYGPTGGHPSWEVSGVFDDVILVQASTQSKAASLVSTYFDGATPSGTSDTEYHYRWTGTPHASTSEKYLPATDDLTENWNVTEQYRHDGTGWERVELSHYVISSADVGKLVAGSAAIKEAVVQKLFAEVVVSHMSIADEFIGENAILTGAVTASKITASEELWAKLGMFVKVRAEQIEADAIDGMVITGSTLKSPGGGFLAGDPGLFIAGPDGTSIVRFPTDGSPLSLTASDVEIDRANVGDFEMQRGSVGSGGSLTIESGVVAPVSPPVGTATWHKIAMLQEGEISGNVTRSGFELWNGKWVRSLNIHSNITDDRIQIFNSDGSLDREFTIDFNPRHGLTVLGDVCYILGVAHTGGVQYIRGYNLVTGKRVKSWKYDRAIQAKNALGNDGTNLVVASVYERALWVHRRSITTGEQIGSDLRSAANTWPSASGSDLNGVRLRGSEVIVVPTHTTRVYTISGSTLNRKTESLNPSGFAGWDTPGSSPVGVHWTATGEPVVVTVTGEVYTSSKRDKNYKLEACVTWVSGSSETKPSPITSIDCESRTFVVLSLPFRPGLSKRVYWRVNGGAWSRNEVGPTVRSFQVNPDVMTTAYPLPTVNTFPETAPAELKTSDLSFQLKGNGSGKWGSLTFNVDGSVAGITRTATGIGVIFPDVAGSTTSGGSQTVVITFPTGRFTAAPSVSAMTSHGRITPVVFNITKTSFSFRVWNFTSSTASAVVGTWMAVQET